MDVGDMAWPEGQWDEGEWEVCNAIGYAEGKAKGKREGKKRDAKGNGMGKRIARVRTVRVGADCNRSNEKVGEHNVEPENDPLALCRHDRCQREL